MSAYFLKHHQGIEVFDGLLDQLFTSDSLPQQPSDKISVIAFAAK